jgi:ABC-type phosphate/phosphonate transport system substrate-binding protein
MKMKLMILSKNCVVVALLLTTVFAGCIGGEDSSDDVIRIAFTVKDDYDNPDANPQLLADFIAEHSGYKVKLYPIANENAAIEALNFGHADVAFLDGGAGYVAWKSHGLEAVIADQKDDGSTSYTAAAWVLNSSNITSLEQLEGKNSCHTGWLKSAGMLMPMGYLIGNGLVDVQGPSDEIESLRTTIEAHFDNASIPSSGGLYYGYSGAFNCITQGVGDVAFAKTSSYEDHCEGNDWCLDLDQYRILEPHFGQVPSHPVIVNPDNAGEKQDALMAAMLALNTEEGGVEILEHVLNTAGLVSVTSEGHLGSYSDAISNIPGITAYFAEKYDD